LSSFYPRGAEKQVKKKKSRRFPSLLEKESEQSLNSPQISAADVGKRKRRGENASARDRDASETAAAKSQKNAVARKKDALRVGKVDAKRLF